MATEIIIVIAILVVVIVFLVTEWLPLEVMALLVLGTLAVTGIVSPKEALAGFSNPAVVTIWAVFILSGGLTRTGIANILGRQLLKVAGSKEWLLVAIIMIIAGGLSAFMNNVAIAALMLPVVMDIARKTDRSPSILLMPLAYGSLLGGLTTMIGTPPNILVSEALRQNGMTPFTLFDFTPVGLVVMLSGVLFVTFVVTRYLPKHAGEGEKSGLRRDFLSQYELQKRLFQIKIPPASTLVGKTLLDSRLGSALKITVVGLTRGGKTYLAPTKDHIIASGDTLIVEGRLDRVQEMNHWGQLLTETDTIGVEALFADDMRVAELQLEAASPFINKTLSEIGFRNRFGLNVLALNRQGRITDADLKTEPLTADDLLIVHGPVGRMTDLEDDAAFKGFQYLSPEDLTRKHPLGKTAAPTARSQGI
jgi:di/tricarboxylate transporter